MDELKAKLGDAEAAQWQVFHADIPCVSPATLHARETGSGVALGRPDAAQRGEGDVDEEADDSWMLSFDYLYPRPDTPVRPEDQRVMEEYMIDRWGFKDTPKLLYSRKSARIMLARYFRYSMAYRAILRSESDAARLADHFVDSFSDPKARFYCNWLGDLNRSGCSYSNVQLPGHEEQYLCDFVMVGMQPERIAAVATWDDD